MEIRHEKFVTTLKEKNKYEKMKEKVRNVNEKQKNMRLNSVIQRLKNQLCGKYVQIFMGLYIFRNNLVFKSSKR